MSIADIMKEAAVEAAQDSRNCHIEQGQLVLRWGGYGYEIELDRLDSPAKILDWVLHLSGKNWMTAQRLGFFIETAADHFGFNVRQA